MKTFALSSIIAVNRITEG